MNYVIRHKTEDGYLYVGVKLPTMNFVFTRSILDAYFYGSRKYAADGVKILKQNQPNVKFQILAV